MNLTKYNTKSDHHFYFFTAFIKLMAGAAAIRNRDGEAQEKKQRTKAGEKLFGGSLYLLAHHDA